MTVPPSVLTIAGSDPSGGAGIQADLRTFASLSAYGMSCITALTAQNTKGVSGVHSVPPSFVADQLDSVVSDIRPVAIKTGMLATAETIKTIVATLRTLYPASSASSSSPSGSMPPLVVDPVTVSTSGHTLLPDSAIQALVHELLPLGALVTPNILETQMLLGDGRKIIDVSDMMVAARDLAALGCRAVLVKGGHLPLKFDDVRAGLAQPLQSEEEIKILWPTSEDVAILKEQSAEAATDTRWVVDILFETPAASGSPRGRFTAIIDRVVPTSSTHGTGCTLSAALAVYLGRGLNLRDATIAAVNYTHNAIATAYPLGSGHGPLNHIHTITYRPLPPPTASNPHPFTRHLIQSIKPLWDAYVNHPFVLGLGKGTLDRRHFEHYIKQDYHYLRHYARGHALAAFKSTSFAQITAFSGITLHIARESAMHVAYCQTFGVTEADLLATPETPATAAYALYILDVGQRGDVLDLVLAMASCCLGYGEVGLKLKEGVEKGEVKFEGNLYKKWIEDYSGKEYQDAVVASIDNLESLVAASPPSEGRLAELTQIWEECTRLEIGFWDGAMNLILPEVEGGEPLKSQA